uniref:Uncharacterized protein n=1 Tax=Salmo trutta TaxID=8032 RepID=A0A674A3S3_SALTR
MSPVGEICVCLLLLWGLLVLTSVVKHVPTGTQTHTFLVVVCVLLFWYLLLSAESEGGPDFRSYEKHWQIHPNKPKKSKSDLAVSNISPPSTESKSLPRSIEHPWWERRESSDFDELNLILQESKTLGKALENLSRSIAVSDELDQNLGGYNSVLQPRVVGEWVGREEEDPDPLAAEMLQPPVPRTKTEAWGSADCSPAGSGKSKGLKQQQQQQHHKRLLAAMLSQDSFDSAPSLTEEEMEDEDDVMELLGLSSSFLFNNTNNYKNKSDPIQIH